MRARVGAFARVCMGVWLSFAVMGGFACGVLSQQSRQPVVLKMRTDSLSRLQPWEAPTIWNTAPDKRDTSLIVHVLDARTGNPVINATAGVLGTWRGQRTDESGNVVFLSLPEDELSFRVHCEGYETKDFVRRVVRGRWQRVTVRIGAATRSSGPRLIDYRSIVGTQPDTSGLSLRVEVVDTSGAERGVARVNVWLPEVPTGTLTGQDGVAMVRHLEPGRWAVQFYARGWGTQASDTVTLRTGQFVKLRHILTGRTKQGSEL